MTELVVNPSVFSMDRAIDDYTEKRTGPRDNDLMYHPSSLYQCDRRVIYDVRNTPREDVFKPGDNRPLLIGNILGPVLQEAIHEQVGKTLFAAWDEPLVEIPELGVRGHADAFVIEIDGHPLLIENKTANSNSLRMILKEGRAKADHIEQAKTYAYGIKHYGFRYGPDDSVLYPSVPNLVDITICYWGKDRHEIKSFHYTLDDEWEEQFRAKIADLETYKADGEALPPRLDRGSWQCNWCPYNQRCWQEDQD